MQERTAPSLSLREILVFVCKYWRRLTLSFCVPFVIAIGLSFLAVPYYIAKSVLIVRLGSEYVYQPEIGGSQTSGEMPIPFQQNQIFKSEAAILASKDLHQDVIETLGVEKLYPRSSLKQFLLPLRDNVDDILISRGLKKPLTPAERASLKLANAVEKFDRHLSIYLEKESAVINVNFENKDPKVATEALDLLLKLYMDKRKQLYLEPRLKMAQDQVKAAHEKALAAEKAVDDYRRSNELHSLEIERSNLLSARNEVERLKASIDSPALDRKEAYFNQRLDKLDTQEQKYRVLQHEEQIADSEYALSVHNMAEAKAFDDLARQREGSVRIIQPAMVSPTSYSLQPLIVLTGLFVSILFTFFVAALTEFGKSGFLTPEELERAFHFPVLAVLPYRKEEK